MSKFTRYEAEKLAWVRLHPGATAQQYEAAIKAIADRLGV